ncbi:Transposable element Tc3 transposase [Anthophora plagiata]
MFPYKVQLVQELKSTDYAQRMDYVISLLEKQDQNPDFINNLIMSDEAHFELNGFVNKQNCRIWATENPRAVHQRQLHPLKCTVWCGISSERIIGPYFFESEAGDAVTINAAQYQAMLENFLRPAVENHPQLWFQQDGATAHTARETMALLRDIFGERIISRNSDFNWPPRSPDLTAPNCFLWAYLKERLYVNKPATTPQLKTNIRNEIRAITPAFLRKIMENVLERARMCNAENGRHLGDVIFHV